MLKVNAETWQTLAMADHGAQGDFSAEVDANIARNLKATREHQGLSQAELAKRVTAIGVPGMHQTTIARIEGGQRSLRAAEAIAISRALETSLEWLSESRASAQLRTTKDYLNENTTKLYALLGEIVHSRRVAAGRLDATYPYQESGEADIDTILSSGVDPDLYFLVEDRLVSSAPHEVLSHVYSGEIVGRNAELYRRPKGNQHKSRLEFIADEMRAYLEDEDLGATPSGIPVRFRMLESDEVFEHEVLALFEAS